MPFTESDYLATTRQCQKVMRAVKTSLPDGFAGLCSPFSVEIATRSVYGKSLPIRHWALATQDSNKALKNPLNMLRSLELEHGFACRINCNNKVEERIINSSANSLIHHLRDGTCAVLLFDIVFNIGHVSVVVSKGKKNPALVQIDLRRAECRRLISKHQAKQLIINAWQRLGVIIVGPQD